MAGDHERSIAIFESESGNVQLEIDPEHETVWATQQEIAAAFECSAENVRQHINNIYSEGELNERATSKKILEVQKEGSRDVSRWINHYNLDLILSVGYRVSSKRATLFRQWATETLKRWLIEGYALNPERVAASPEIQRRLHATLRQIRTSEKSIYSKVKDVFKLSASDYAEDSRTTKSFYAMAQDKFHFAITEQTAAQIVLERADAQMSNMGLTTMSSEPVFPISGVFRLKGQPKRDGSIIVRSCKASQSPVYPIRDAILAVNHASCPFLSSSCPCQCGETALKTRRLPEALSPSWQDRGCTLPQLGASDNRPIRSSTPWNNRRGTDTSDN